MLSVIREIFYCARTSVEAWKQPPTTTKLRSDDVPRQYGLKRRPKQIGERRNE